MVGLITLGATVGSAAVGYLNSRAFVRGKLRYVDAVQRWSAPWIAGIAAALLAAPVVWLLPLVGAGTAIVFGASVAMGVAHGAREIRRGMGYELGTGG